MKTPLLLFGLLLSASAVEPTVKILDVYSELVKGEYVTTRKWRLSVEGEYILKTIEISEYEEFDKEATKVVKKIQEVLKQPPGVCSDSVTQETIEVGADEREDFDGAWHKRSEIEGFGRAFEFPDADLTRKGGGGVTAGIDVQRARAGVVGPVVTARRTFYFREHKSDTRKRISFRLEVLKSNKAIQMLRQAGVKPPQEPNESWSIELPAKTSRGEQGGADQPATAVDLKPENKKNTEPESKVRPQ